MLWLSRYQDVFVRERRNWVSDKYFNQAKEILNSDISLTSGWANYLKLISSKLNYPLPTLGTFALVIHYQLMVESIPEKRDEWQPSFFSPPSKHTRSKDTFQLGQIQREAQQQRKKESEQTPSKAGAVRATDGVAFANKFAGLISSSSLVTPSVEESARLPYMSPMTPAGLHSFEFFPSTKDEQIVNTALVTFLDAITIHHREIKARWTFERKEFKCMNDQGAGYKAKVDGFLYNPKDELPMIILEVKPCIRGTGRKANSIRMQEGS